MAVPQSTQSGDSRRQQKTNLKNKSFCLLLFEGTFTKFFKDKKSKISHTIVRVRIKVLLDDRRMIEGSGSGSTPLTNGSRSGSVRPKNMWIRVRIRCWLVRVGGARPPPFSHRVQSCSVGTLLLRGQNLSLCFISTPVCTL
jgi:hypothetical protein